MRLSVGRAMVLRFLLDSRSCLTITAFIAVLLASGCAQPQFASNPQFVTSNAMASKDSVYRLGVGDKFKLTVFGEDNLSGQFEVNAVGQASLPLIGELPAKGLSQQEFRDQIARKLSDGYLKNPKVTVEMLTYRPIYVHGEVKNGGEFPYKTGLSLRDVVAIAGGYTYRANQDVVYMSRAGKKEVAVQLPADIPVLPGDNIQIPERFF